jgi:hypothetical protein
MRNLDEKKNSLLHIKETLKKMDGQKNIRNTFIDVLFERIWIKILDDKHPHACELAPWFVVYIMEGARHNDTWGDRLIFETILPQIGLSKQALYNFKEYIRNGTRFFNFSGKSKDFVENIFKKEDAKGYLKQQKQDIEEELNQVCIKKDF